MYFLTHYYKPLNFFFNRLSHCSGGVTTCAKWLAEAECEKPKIYLSGVQRANDDDETIIIVQ